MLRTGTSAALRKDSRATPDEMTRGLAKRAASRGGAERIEGMARAGTRAASMAGPCGAVEGAMRAERPGDASRIEGCAGVRYVVG